MTNLEFKEAIRKLQTGLTSKDIDDLINATPMTKDGRIDYNDFIKKMKETYLYFMLDQPIGESKIVQGSVFMPLKILFMYICYLLKTLSDNSIQREQEK